MVGREPEVEKGGQAWLVVDPPDGKIPALTPEGQRRAQAAGRVRSSFVGGPFDGPEDFSLLDRCISRSVPGSMIPVMYGNVYQIVQTPGFVVITYEIIHEARVIPLDGRPHIGRGIRQHMGDARGHWEGDSLVVETTNFTKPRPTAAPIPRLCVSSNASRAPQRTGSRGRRRSTTRRRGRAPWTVGMSLTADPQRVLPSTVTKATTA